MRSLFSALTRRRRVDPVPCAPEITPRDAIASIGEPFVSTLCSMYAGDPQIGVDGKKYPIDAITRIGPAQGMLIYRLIREAKPEKSLEIGLAFGFSTVYFLAALQANGMGHHIAVDPFQYEWWHGIGVTRERVLGLKTGSFEFVQETSVQALARFAREQQRFGVIFIDGDHTFDGVLIDFSLASLVCGPGAYIILDDMWLPSIQRAVSFIRLNRADFEIVSTPAKNFAVFRRIDTDKRNWDHFVPF
jgi:predicted O-methyltransferase YrrM